MNPMPIYEYRCDDCRGLTAKLVRGFDAPDAIPCGDCSGENTHRIISSVAFHKSLSTQLNELDPRYDRMVDAAADSTADADENRFLKSAIPLDAADM